MNRLEYRLARSENGAPLIILDSPMGSGQDISPTDLRKLADALLTVANEAEQTELASHELWKVGVCDIE
ncbi:Uncharacterised protein [Burkholderia pseudomallei]|nr:Uncharacterised protein [Burkholderia pseudomallei]CAJ6697288.1 Uncharacterised protein [Burkholderia pseudomallei]